MSGLAALWAIGAGLLLSGVFLGRRARSEAPGERGFAASTHVEAARLKVGLTRADGVLAVLAGLIAGYALLHGFEAFGGRDWDWFQADLFSARRSLLSAGELPLWMPYRAGGCDAFGEPQSLWASPLGLLSLLFGVPWGTRVFLALSVTAAALGAQLLGAHFRLGLLGRSTIALLFACSAPLGLYAAGGVPTFTLGLVLLPWITTALLRGTRGSLLVCGALLALDFYGGDVNHLVFHALFVTLMLVGRAAIERDPRQLLALIVVGVSAATFSAPKLVPAAAFARSIPRPGSGKSRGALTLRLLYYALLDRDAVRFVEGPYEEFVVITRSGELVHGAALEDALPETAIDWIYVGVYVGWGGLLLAALGLVVVAWSPRGPPAPRGRNEQVVLAGVCAIFLWLSFGANVTPSGWRVLHELPVFSSLRSPDRLILYPFFGVAVFAGLGSDWLRRALRRRRGVALARWSAVLLFLALGFDVVPPSLRAYRKTFVEPDRFRLGRLPADTGFLQTHVERPAGSTYYGPPVAPFAEAGIGVPGGYAGPLPISRCAIPRQSDRYRGEAFLLNSERSFRPGVSARRLRVAVKADRADALVFNQNWARGWEVETPEGLSCRRAEDGRLCVDVPAGETQLVLRYTSPGLWAGLFIGLLGSPLLVLGVLRFKTRRSAR